MYYNSKLGRNYKSFKFEVGVVKFFWPSQNIRTLERFLATRANFAPFFAKCRAVAAPIPELEPARSLFSMRKTHNFVNSAKMQQVIVCLICLRSVE